MDRSVWACPFVILYSTIIQLQAIYMENLTAGIQRRKEA